MTPEARRAAREKLGSHVGVGRLPGRWRDYSRLRIAPDDLLGNAQRAFEFDNAYNMRMLRRRDDRRPLGDAAADGQRLLRAGAERDRAARRHPAAAALRSRRQTMR